MLAGEWSVSALLAEESVILPLFSLKIFLLGVGGTTPGNLGDSGLVKKNDFLPVSSPNWQCPWNLYNFQSLDWDVKVREKRAHLEKGSLIFLSKHINYNDKKNMKLKNTNSY